MDSKTEPASEAKEHECEYYNDIESVAYECICGNVEINSRKYIPEDKAELEREIEKSSFLQQRIDGLLKNGVPF